MRIYSFLFLSIIGLLSCRSNDKNKVKVKETLTKNRSIYDEFTRLPFGSDVLISHIFPNGWDTPSESNYNNPVGPHEKAFYEIIKFYNHLNKIEYITAPQFSEFKYLNIGEDTLITKNNTQYKNSIRYRLPDFDGYQCYYASNYYTFGEIEKNPISTKDFKQYMSVGNLILYKKETKSASILNILNSYAYQEGDYNCYRFFFIDKNMKIKIFEGCAGEGSCNLKLTHEIRILSNAEISIKEIK